MLGAPLKQTILQVSHNFKGILRDCAQTFEKPSVVDSPVEEDCCGTFLQFAR